MNDELWGHKPAHREPETASRTSAAAGPASEGAHKELNRQLVDALTREQRRNRRWGIFFKLLGFGYLTVMLVLYAPGDLLQTEVGDTPHTALVDVSGPIAADTPANADNIATGLSRAFEDERTRAVILRINSPGGSPVQAGRIYDEIRRLRAEHESTPVYAVIGDIGASGAYYVAAAADEIYADKASLVGSIGVISAGFGFVDTLEKLGVERRLVTAGEHKAFLDPFSPLEEEEKAFWKEVLEKTHEQFVSKVKEGRGGRLQENDKVFSGLIWTGEQALALGLLDGLASPGQVAREVVGVERIFDYTQQPSAWERLADRLGTAMARTLATHLGLAEHPLPLR